MADSMLKRAGSDPASLARLSEADQLAVVHLLLEWGATDDALAILVSIPDNVGDEWRAPAAEALLHAGRYPEAAAMAGSLKTHGAVRDSLRARALAAAGDLHTALALAESQVATPQGAGHAAAWTLLGEIQMRRGSLPDAEVAFTQACRLDAHDPAPRVGLVRAAFAVSPEQAAEMARALLDDRGPAALRNEELNQIALALQSGGASFAPHLRLAQRDLVDRYERALQRLRTILNKGVRTAAPVPGEVATPRDDGGLLVAAHTIFGHTRLLPTQSDVIAATRRGEDVLAIMPTGSGKSLCYQLPAFLDGGLTLVVSPLVALMKDQLDNLPARLRPAAVALHGGIEPAQLQAALEGMRAGRFHLVYVAPERLRQRQFVASLRTVGLTRMVIDEAHCVAVWGHDFRPDYLHLPRAHADLGAPPLLALTATAPPALRADIARHLFGEGDTLRRPYSVFAADPTRDNLWLGVRLLKSEREKTDRLVRLCQSLPGAGIVYMRTRAQTEEVAAALRAANVAAAAYHAGLPNRATVQERFMAGETRVIVATVAFGMGVNKPDIRFILHGSLPGSLEAYVQEVGRAGRDGYPAVCLLLVAERELQFATQTAGDDTSDGLLQALLRKVIEAVGTKRSGLLSIEEVGLALGVDETSVRVAMSLLEEAGLIVRDYDPPRSISLYLRKAGRSAEFGRFLRASGLAPGKPAEWTFGELSVATGIDLLRLESKLLEWQGAGFISYYGRGKSMLITLRARPQDAIERVQRIVKARAASHHKRSEQMANLVRSRTCRQVALAEYLANETRTPCGNCDMCGVTLASAVQPPAGNSSP